MPERVYIAGPIGGRPNGNRDAFARRAVTLRAAGFEPVNPWEVDHSHGGGCSGRDTGRPGDPHRYTCYLLADIRALASCDAISLLDGWASSPGARAEVAFAAACGIPHITAGSRRVLDPAGDLMCGELTRACPASAPPQHRGRRGGYRRDRSHGCGLRGYRRVGG
jgi:hypothetical protein